ncbi:MAG: hypothetical protein IIA27_15560 [Gemmatimonadetes bacterium]|nr:hypothetical protein [Gemmatimonadota bacterium]
MSILTGAELGGGLPPPASPTLIQQADRDKESSIHAVPFSSEAAILQLTNSATRAVVQRGQELMDRRNEKNAAEKDQAREVAAEEARNRSLEEQGLKEPETDEDQAAVNTVQSEVANTAQGKEVVESKAPEIAAVPLGTPAVVTGDAPADGEQETEVVDESGRLDVVA